MELGSQSLKRSFLRFVIPSVLAQWVYALYNMVDGIFVAKGINEVALTAVNLSNPFLQFMFALSLLFAVGTSTAAAIHLGTGERERASQIFTQNVVTQVVLGFVLVVLVMPNLDLAASFLGAKDPETLGYVKEYLMFVVPFAPFFLLSYAFEVLLKTDGFPQKAVIIVVTGAVENCILDWLLVIVLHKGVAGAAFATGFSQFTLTLIYLHHFWKKKGTIHLVRFRFSFALLCRKVRNGFSAALTEMSAGAVTLIFNRVILMFLSRDALVSYAIVSYINSLVVFSIIGVVQGSQPLISYHYGRRDPGTCQTLLRYTLCTAVAFCLASMALCALMAGEIVTFYIGPDLPQLREYSAAVIRIFICSFLFLGPNAVLSGYLAAVEVAIPAAVVSAARGFVLLVGSLALLTGLFGGAGIWWSPLLSEGLTFAIALPLFLSYRKKVFPNTGSSL